MGNKNWRSLQHGKMMKMEEENEGKVQRLFGITETGKKLGHILCVNHHRKEIKIDIYTHRDSIIARADNTPTGWPRFMEFLTTEEAIKKLSNTAMIFNHKRIEVSLHEN
jgi:hypothetical protein